VELSPAQGEMQDRGSARDEELERVVPQKHSLKCQRERVSIYSESYLDVYRMV
jgi:hypothetical protein